jgi:hypothetical protein
LQFKRKGEFGIFPCNLSNGKINSKAIKYFKITRLKRSKEKLSSRFFLVTYLMIKSIFQLDELFIKFRRLKKFKKKVD